MGADISSLELRGRLVTCLGSILALAIFTLFAGRLGGVLCAIAFLLLASLHPRLLETAGSIQPEGLHALFVASALYLLVLPRPPRWAGVTGFAAGALFGLAYLTRPEGFLIGIVASGMVLATGSEPWGRRARKAGCILLGMGLVASPYLLFLHRHLGTWAVTGKSAEIFFIGQALDASGGTPFDAEDLLRLKEQWGGILPYAAANPRKTLLAVLRNGGRVWLGIVPRMLGPAGILGCLLAAVFWLRKGWRTIPVLLLSPLLTLFIMAFTFPNERVCLSVLPFLFLLAALGLAPAADWLDSAPRARWRPAGAVFVVLLLLGQGRGLALFAWSRISSVVPLETRAIREALALEADPQKIASSNPVISFRLSDPFMFSPSFRYEPLPIEGPCAALDHAMRERGSTVAILDRAGNPPAIDLSPEDCPWSIVKRLSDPAQGRSIWVLARRSPAPVPAPLP
jgi:hypothetical protein